MSDRYSYSSPFGRGSDPWFRVGQIDVTTTVAVIGMGVFSMLIWAFEGDARGISKHLWLVSSDTGLSAVLDGAVWRLFTWPLSFLPDGPDFWTIVLFAIFYMLGSQLENLLGRRPFMWFLLGLTVVPALSVTILELVLGDFGGFAAELRFIELGVFVAFAAQYPRARFWPGIPAAAMAGIILAIDYIQILGHRNDYEFVLLTVVIVTAVVGMRSFGHATELPWVPAVRLPASVTGVSTRAAKPASKRRGRGNLRAVPTRPAADPLADMEIDALLDQVAERGLDSLTKEQRKRLEEHSKRLRKRRDS